jgi:hypothetical protein
MNRRTGLLVAAVMLAASLPAFAQWLNVPTKDIPRTKDGRPDLAAPAPRKPYSKPDLSGVWTGERQTGKYLNNLAADFKPGEFSIQPWAEALSKARMTDEHAGEYPSVHCLPQGIPILDASPAPGYPLKIIQERELIVILYEIFGQFRQIFLDGRTLPKDPNPTWLGYSVGHWDGDSLVVDSAGFNGKTWLDNRAGHPSTDALHVTERFLRRDFGHLDLQLTIDDRKAYNKPWTVTETLHISPDTELMEFVCNENEKDLKHLPGK